MENLSSSLHVSLIFLQFFFSALRFCAQMMFVLLDVSLLQGSELYRGRLWKQPLARKLWICRYIMVLEGVDRVIAIIFKTMHCPASIYIQNVLFPRVKFQFRNFLTYRVILNSLQIESWREWKEV